MTRLLILLMLCLSSLVWAHPSDYPNGVDPKIDPRTQTNSQAFDESHVASNKVQSNEKFEQLKLGQLAKNNFFKGVIDLTLLVLAGFHWFNFVANFDPQKAFAQTLVPAMLTFLAFQWNMMLSWLSL